jgi:hypothetical protein
VEETLRKFFEVDPARDDWRLSTLEILEVLKDPQLGNLKVPSEINERRLSTALTSLGLSKPVTMRFSNKLMRGYIGIARRLLP